MIYDLKTLCNAYQSGEKCKFLFFWGHTAPANGQVNECCLSQWWSCSFVVDGVQYSCTEQFMMAQKARLFHDDAMLVQILQALHPKQMKEFGRAVKNFDAEIWESHCYEIVKQGNLAKFSQNPALWAFLKTTKNRILVEASPRDRIWGIGMGKSNPDAENPLKWRGKNRLGFALSEVRDILLEKERE